MKWTSFFAFIFPVFFTSSLLAVVDATENEGAASISLESVESVKEIIDPPGVYNGREFRGEYDIVIGYLNDDLKHINTKLDSLDDDLSSVLSKVDSLDQKNSFLSNVIEETKSNSWDILNVVFGVIAMVTAVAGVAAFTVIRENSNAQRAMDLQEKELEIKRSQISNALDEIIISLGRKANKELDFFQKRMRLQEIVLNYTGKPVDAEAQDEVYQCVRHLDSEPRAEYISIYNKLLKLSLEPEVKASVDDALARAKELIVK